MHQGTRRRAEGRRILDQPSALESRIQRVPFQQEAVGFAQLLAQWPIQHGIRRSRGGAVPEAQNRLWSAHGPRIDRPLAANGFDADDTWQARGLEVAEGQ